MANIVDLSGEKFGHVTAIEVVKGKKMGRCVIWKCLCDCGNTTEKSSHSLIYGKKYGMNTSCGCENYLDISGKRFGKLTALKRLRSIPGRGVLWLFRCECGKEIEKFGALVSRGMTALHCGCYRRGFNPNKNLEGRRFGHLLVISFAGLGGRGSCLWKCKCDCGKEVIIRGDYLRRFKTHCGCVTRNSGKDNPSWRGFKDIPSSVISNIVNGAKIRKISFDLTPKQLWKLYLSQKKKCALSGVDISFSPIPPSRKRTRITASLDRIDSSKGYEINNVQWVHKDINRMKNSLKDSDFICLCKKVSDWNS